MKINLFILLGLLVLPLLLVAAAPDPAGIAGEPVIYKKVGDRELHLYVVKSPDWRATDRRPAIVFIHGGGWVGGSVTQFNDQSKYLASRGMVCVQVEYRLSKKNQPGPPVVCCEDAKSAMRYVRSHAAELGIDPDRIAAGGGSAREILARDPAINDGGESPSRPLPTPATAELVGT